MNYFMHMRIANDVALWEPMSLNAALAINPGDALQRILDPKSAEPTILSALRDQLADKPTRLNDGVTIIPISGPLANRPSTLEMLMGGMQDSVAIRDHVMRAAADTSVPAIVLDINSPGGMHNGGPELADAVRSASTVKPVVAYGGGLIASLAYMVASQATEIVATSSSSIGSIGTYFAIPDVTKAMETQGVKMEVFTNTEGKFKTAGLPGTSLSPDHRQYLQARADEAFGHFKSLVNRARPGVSSEAMQGQLFWAQKAKEEGLVDRIGDLPFAVSVARYNARTRGQARTPASSV